MLRSRVTRRPESREEPPAAVRLSVQLISAYHPCLRSSCCLTILLIRCFFVVSLRPCKNRNKNDEPLEQKEIVGIVAVCRHTVGCDLWSGAPLDSDNSPLNRSREEEENEGKKEESARGARAAGGGEVIKLWFARVERVFE
ncbi:hypothetical protein L596_018357 [Steinernema carpocapsae]|uniref:Uncharacterized protein n=1 Tax=Steinernema carpocapsae TaxID=34508 RepID=A0A4U5N4E2_STECR|nr:hypothetical protein L596_018357 [Steinernema carpocapsae]